MARKAGGNTPTFESRMERLEQIVESLESGDRPLDDVMAMFEEGIRLSAECLEHLDRTELRLKTLARTVKEKLDTAMDDDGR